MRDTIYATFASAETAKRVVGSLLDYGVKPEDLSVFVNETSWQNAEGDHTDANDVKSTAEQGVTVTTTEDAAAGAKTGAGVGLGVGALAALAAVTIPGVGLVLGGGALAAAIGGVVAAGAAGAVAGAVTGYLKDQGVEPAAVDKIATTLETGGALVSVSHPSGDVSASTIESVFDKYGGKTGLSIYRTTPHPVGSAVHPTTYTR
jgi:hypothetical protein